MPITSKPQQKLTEAMANGRVTWREADSVIEAVKADGTVSRSELTLINRELAGNADAFDAGARLRFQSLVGQAKVPTSPAEDPSIAKEDLGKVSYGPVKGKLFVDGAKGSDVVQGYLGNCYLMSSFAAVAERNPKAIENAIHDNGDGTYSARFYDFTDDGQRFEVFVGVDADLPLADGKPHYGANQNQDELWVPLLEKAYAKWKGTYDSIGKGGYATESLSALTGSKSDFFEFGKTPDEKAIYGRLERALSAGKSVVTSTDRKDARYTNTGVYANHAYSVHRVFSEDGKRYVELRNPWGSSEPSGNGADDGVFRLELTRYVELFVDMSFA